MGARSGGQVNNNNMLLSSTTINSSDPNSNIELVNILPLEITSKSINVSHLITNDIISNFSSINYNISIFNITIPSILLPHSTSETKINNNESISDWGPKRDALYIVIPITVIYILIFFTGLVGNISTCIVIFRNRSMHTATNFYLFSLAISDLLLLLSGLPHEMYSMWSRYPYVFGETFCVLQGLAAETSANATVLTITAFTIERYVAICHPFLSHTLSRLSRAVRLVIILWVAALCLAIPQALEFGVVYETFPDGTPNTEHSVCAVKRVLIPHAFEVSTLLFFVVPMTLITVLYVLIGIRLHSSSSIARSASMNNGVIATMGQNLHDPAGLRDSRKNYARNAQNRATKHVVKMLVAVVAAFFICWAPFHAQRLLAVHGYSGEIETSPAMVEFYTILTYVSGVLYYLSTTVNPVLYHIMSNKFRDAFKDTLARCVGKRRGIHGRRRLYSGLSRSSRPDTMTDSSTTCCRDDVSLHGAPRRANSLRYLEADVARQGQRPLVVSFRRPQAQPEPSVPSATSDVRVYVSVEAGGRSRPAAYLSVLYRAPSESKSPRSQCPLHELPRHCCHS